MSGRPLKTPGRRSPKTGAGVGGELRKWVRRFLTSYLPQHRGATANTINSYGQALKGFLAFLANRKRKRGGATFRDLSPENVLRFLAGLQKKRANGASTRNARLAAIRSFARYAFLMSQIGRNRHERLRQIAFKRGAARAVTYLEVAELDAIFKAVDHRTRDGFRDLVILKLLYNTGARASEAASLRISDLDLSGCQITITGKGGKRRTCGLWETTAALLRIYITTERRMPRRGFEDSLFISQRRRPLTRFGIYDIVRRYVRKVAKACPSLAKKKVTPHVFRHTTAVHLVESGVDFNTVRDWLGHAHMSTTEIYARPNLRVKRLALAKLQDLDRKLFDKVTGDRKVSAVAPSIRRWLKSLSE